MHDYRYNTEMARSFMYVCGLCIVMAFVENVPLVASVSAVCTMQSYSGTGPISGVIRLNQPVATPGTPVTFEVQLSGFSNQAGALHGFHVHEKGDLGNKCNNSGPHYNPDNVAHGAPNDTIRHVGDLGNIVVGANGQVNVMIIDTVMSLVGDRSIIGRAIVVHEMADDLGRGNFSDSKTTGHSGLRMGCCVITQNSTGKATSTSANTGFVAILVAFIAIVIGLL